MSELFQLISLDIKQIIECIPHRYPILLVDRVLEVKPGSYCKALKNVSVLDPYFQGHYPGNPIMPGVLIVEAVAQASSLMILTSEEFQNSVPLLISVHEAKFKKPVVPGDQLIIETELIWFRNKMGRVRGTVNVEGSMVASCEITCALK